MTNRTQGVADVADLSALRQLLVRRGHEQYTGEPVSHLAHGLQAATLARRAGADDALVVAALLHDIGHLVTTHTGTPTLDGIDDQHEQLGAQLLSQWFGAAVVEPVRWHVQAKRYLVTNPGYLRALSEDSQRSLALQGGPMDAEQQQTFMALPWAQAALALRRWDEGAKVPDWAVADLDAVWPLVQQVAATHPPAQP